MCWKTENFLNRNPASENTLGYDAGILDIINNSNKVIKNGDTKATIGLRSSQDVYFYYFNAIALDIIEPKIILTKSVLDKYNSGIILLKKDGNGDFKRLKTNVTNGANGNITYSSNNCQ